MCQGQAEIQEQTAPALCSPGAFAHDQEDPSYGFMESNTAKCALRLISQNAFIPPSMVEQLSAFINSRSIFIKTDGSAVLKLHRSHLDRSLLFIFPDRRSEQGYFQDTVHISLQAVSNAGANTLSRTGSSTCAWLPAAEADVVSPKRSQAPALYSESSVSQRQTEAQLLARLPQIPA